jgi:sortase B
MKIKEKKVATQKKIKRYMPLVIALVLIVILFIKFQEPIKYVIDTSRTEITAIQDNKAYIDSGAVLADNQEAFLIAPQMDVNMPVMKEPVNDITDKKGYYYLNHDTDNRYSISGSIFTLADRNTSKDKVITLFGHYMRNGSMFGNIDAYSDGSPDDNNPYVRLDTHEKTRYYEYTYTFEIAADNPVANQYFAGTDWTSTKPGSLNFSDYMVHIGNTLINGDPSKIAESDDILQLSTCSNSGQSRKIAVFKEISVEGSEKVIKDTTMRIMPSKYTIYLLIGAVCILVVIIGFILSEISYYTTKRKTK